MVQEKREVSLKRPDGRWGGQSDQSYFAPTEGAFEKLINCYISQDGTEIRRMPPLSLWVDPVLADGPLGVTAMLAGANTNVTFTQPHRLPDTSFAFSSYRVFVSGNGAIPDGWYPIYRRSDTEATIGVTTTTTDTTHGFFQIERATKPHGLRMVGNRLAVVAESRASYVLPTGANLIKDHLATWVQDRPIDFRATRGSYQYWPSPLNAPDVPAPVAGLIPASGIGTSTTTIYSQHGYAKIGEQFTVTIAGFAARGVPNGTYNATVFIPYEAFSIAQSNTASGSDTAGTVTYIYQAYSRPIRRRMQLDVADGRLLIAAPGEGICFQADVGYSDVDTSTLRKRTKLLGLPKGVMAGTLAFNNGPTGGLAPGNYWVAVGYHDTRTNEYGIISEAVLTTVTAPQNAIKVFLHTPRAELREVTGASIIVYMSDVNSGQGTMRQVFETEAAGQLVSYFYDVTVNALVTSTNHVPILENMPIGATSVRTIKGISFFCCQLSSPYAPSILSAEQTKVSIDYVGRDQIVFSPTSDPLNGLTTLTAGMAADYQIPSSIGGHKILINSLPITQLDKKLNSAQDVHLTGGGFTIVQHHLWQITTQHAPGATVPYVPRDATVQIPRGIVWFTEQGFPGVSPSINRIPVDRLEGFDVLALGRLGDVLIMCTDKETYSLTWDRSPLGVNPRAVSTEYGCIAPSSMVQFDGGLAWISERGPVMMTGGGFRWISSAISDTWRQYSRDSRGWMPHAFAAHDPTRKLLLFFVRRDRQTFKYAAAMDDDTRSKVPCDEVLAYSYAADAWSTWELPPEHECVDATEVLCFDGLRRVAILTDSKLVYAWDESLHDTQVLVDVRLETKSNLWPSTRTPLERATKVGAVNLRVDATQLYPDKREVGFLVRCTAFDDFRKETYIADVENTTQNRTRLSFGAVRAQESKISIRFLGVGQLRVKDITVELSPGG